MLTEEAESAKAAGLRYSIPNGQSIIQRRAGSGFVYFGPDRKRITDQSTRQRIRSLVIPPAWTSVWISPYANAHIQAVGRDARGRKQYRYHADYRRFRDQIKFDRMNAFGNALGRMRYVGTRSAAQRNTEKESSGRRSETSRNNLYPGWQ